MALALTLQTRGDEGYGIAALLIAADSAHGGGRARPGGGPGGGLAPADLRCGWDAQRGPQRALRRGGRAPVPPALRGRAAGVFASVANCANLFGYALGGVLAPIFAPRALFIGTGLAGLAVAVAFLTPAVLRGTRATVAVPAAVAVGYRRKS